jgi:GT2 family glycosyltransferase
VSDTRDAGSSVRDERDEITIVVAARERFSGTRDALETLYAVTPPPFRLVYVDGGAPAATARYLRARASALGFTLLRPGGYQSPDVARNLGFAEVRTRYAVFLDNDVIVARGWLDALLTCAEETGAAVVAPLYCVDRPWHMKIHMAGGVAHIEERNGVRRFVQEHCFMHQPLAALRPRLARVPTEQAEFHCMLVRSDVMRALGPLDERFCGVPEAQIDRCLAVRARGDAVYFEPAAVVTYDRSPRLRLSDLPFFLWRWSDARGRRGLEHFRRTWQLDAGDPYFEGQLAFMAAHRRRALRSVRPLWLALRLLGRSGRVRAADRLIGAAAALAGRRRLRCRMSRGDAIAPKDATRRGSPEVPRREGRAGTAGRGGKDGSWRTRRCVTR